MPSSSHCPGQDGRMLTASLHKCPGCGHIVEMFSDEQSVRCRKCGERVVRESVPSCAQWCAGARGCLGEKRWKELLEGKVEEEGKGEDD